ncbi:hypothetical protein MKZ20_05935 [Psychrobacillus sp. FSL K6-2684]|nr:hypothetical protein [Psychrobacillus sp. AK 1817]QGM30899.1 hypothetical protein GI482_11135 [Bacillus sp. N3536]
MIEAMMKKMPREKAMDKLSQLLHISNENFGELTEYCCISDEIETTNR